MPGLVLLGAQWGDEGKGKVTDYLSSFADMVVRYQGGNNAGHTVVVDGEEFKLRLIPSGIISGHALCVIGNGVVVDVRVLLQEIEYLKSKGVDVSRLRVSDRCHIIMPYHIRQDELEESAKGISKLGTTKNGIGPCYMDKCARIGLRIGDLLDKALFKERLEESLKVKNHYLTKVYSIEEFSFDEIYKEYVNYTDVLKDIICDTSLLIHKAYLNNEKIVFEGAQGTLLDLDHGTYPYVTSSNPTAGFACTGSGVGPNKIDSVLGIVKAYTTRVGEGPFPTELFDEDGALLQSRGHEFGTVTGRTRRCGWLDIPLLMYAIRLSGMDQLAIMKLDVLDALPEIKICTAYELNGEPIDYFPANLNQLSNITPVYETLQGWNQDTSVCKKFDELPIKAREYIKRIEELTNLTVNIVAVGPGREETIICGEII